MVLFGVRVHEGHELLDPAAQFPIQDDGDLRENAFRALSIFLRRNEEGSGTNHRRGRRYQFPCSSTVPTRRKAAQEIQPARTFI